MLSSTLYCAWLLVATMGMAASCSAPEIDAGPTPEVFESTPVPASVMRPILEGTPADKTEPAITPIAVPKVSPKPLATPTPTPLPTATPVPTVVPTQTVEAISLSLALLTPVEGAGIEVGAVRVLGVTSPRANVKVNGIETDVASNGTFQRDLMLQEGINSIAAIATGPSGDVVSDNVVVLFVPRPEGVPLSVLFPQGLEVSEPEITIIGATRQDVIVGVNGVPVDVNSLGIFSTQVPLEVGANLIEVVAVDLKENVNFQTVVVFYIA